MCTGQSGRSLRSCSRSGSTRSRYSTHPKCASYISSCRGASAPECSWRIVRKSRPQYICVYPWYSPWPSRSFSSSRSRIVEPPFLWTWRSTKIAHRFGGVRWYGGSVPFHVNGTSGSASPDAHGSTFSGAPAVQPTSRA